MAAMAAQPALIGKRRSCRGLLLTWTWPRVVCSSSSWRHVVASRQAEARRQLLLHLSRLLAVAGVCRGPAGPCGLVVHPAAVGVHIVSEKSASLADERRSSNCFVSRSDAGSWWHCHSSVVLADPKASDAVQYFNQRVVPMLRTYANSN